jgi:membrane associated rhomboid family serine protease
MREAPVGWQCASCVHEGARTSPTVRWRPRTPGRLGATRITPVVTAIIVINVVVYLLSQTDFNRTIYRFALWPNQIHHGQSYRLLTAAFLHANIEHILFNMITLAIIGPPVEAELGRVRFGVLYLVAALGGSVASYLLSSPNELGVGASGAIFGLMGAYFVLARRNRWDTSTIGVLIIVNLVIGFASSTIDWRAHLGGLVTGAVMAFALARSGELRPRAGAAISMVATGASMVVVLGVLAALAQVAPGHFNL